MSEEKKNEVTEETKEEARQLSEEELAKVSGGDTGFAVGTTQYIELSGCYGFSTKIHGVEDEGAIPPCR